MTDGARLRARRRPARGPDRAARRRAGHRTTAPAGSTLSLHRRRPRTRRPTTAPVRVPPGVTVFDAASLERHRHRLHLRRPRHLQEVQGPGRRRHACRSPRLDVRTFTADQLDDGWRLACLAQATSDLDGRRAAADHPAQGRDRRRRPAGDPAAGDPEAVRRARRADARRPAHRPATGCSTRSTTSSSTADLHVLRRLPTVLREADFKVTAVVVDEALIDVEPGDTTDARGTPSPSTSAPPPWSPPCSTSATGTPVAVRVDAQQAAAVRRRRDHPDQRHDDGPRRARPAAASWPQRHARRAGRARSAREAGVDPRARLRGRARRQRHDDRARARHRPRAARRRAVRDVDRARRRRCSPPTSGSTVHPRARAVVFPALGAYVGGDIVAGMLATGMDRDKRTRLFIDVGTNCEIVLSDGDTHPVHRRAGRAGVRGRRDPLRHARRRRRDRGRQAGRRRRRTSSCR